MASASCRLDHVTKLDFKPAAVTPLIHKLLSQTICQDDEKGTGKTRNAESNYLQLINQNDKTNNIYKILQHPFLYFWITPHSIIGNKMEFKFKFNLYVDDYDNKHGQCVFKYIFIATFNDIKTIYIKALGERKYFPVQKLPTLLPETLSRRSDELKQDLLILDQYSLLQQEMKSIDGTYTCKGPGKKQWWSKQMRAANMNDINTLSYILCKLFNSPSYCYMDTAFDEFMTKCNIINDMKRIIKSKGFILLNSLRLQSLKFTVKDVKNRHDELYLDAHKKKMKFHTITVCARPVHGVKNVSLIDHWALKFEGDEYLLTLDYYANSRVIAIICKNNCIGQKIHWYSWCANSRQFFTCRWGTLSKIYLTDEMEGISGECIGYIIEKWKRKYSKYCSMTNNCQHFVRDILTVFAVNAAKYLSTQFHHRVVEGIIFPSLPFMDELDEQKRMKEIRSILYKEFQKYHQMKKQEKVSTSVDCEQKEQDEKCEKYEKYDKYDMEHGIPDINEEMFEVQQSQLRFEEWLCKELGMDKYLALFKQKNVDQVQFIQWFNVAVIMNDIGVECKVHALFITQQAEIFNIENNKENNVNINVYKNKFVKWLCEDVKLDKYLMLFRENNMDDIRQIQFFDQESLKNIGVQLTAHCKLILEQANKYKNQ